MKINTFCQRVKTTHLCGNTTIPVFKVAGICESRSCRDGARFYVLSRTKLMLFSHDDVDDDDGFRSETRVSVCLWEMCGLFTLIISPSQ